jgi:hypothetical protein
MAVGNNFAKVREAFCANVAEMLRRLNVEIKAQTPKGDWLQIACPLCTDKSGSASVSIASGFLRCHQCASKADLFTWTGKLLGTDQPWLVCQALAKLVGIEVEGVSLQKKLYKHVPEITEETFADFKQRLFEDPDQEIAREFLRKRGFWLPDQLEELPIGAWGGKIVFAQHTDDGRLRKRCRVYDPFPLNGQPKWSWNKVKGETGRTVGFWPFLPSYLKTDVDVDYLLCEGEWDVLAALLILQLRSRKWAVQTWTGGGGAPIPADAVQGWVRNKNVHLLYDNDVFQGLGDDLAPDEKKLAELRVRKKNLLDVIGPAFEMNRCAVSVRAITLPPLEQWGGDLRDMVNAGLQSIDELPRYKLGECRRSLRQAKRVQFDKVHEHLGEYIEFRCQVAGVAEDVAIKMKLCAVKCEMGQQKFCDHCKLPEIAPNGVIDFAGLQSELAAAMTDTNVPKHIMERIAGKPNSCKRWQIQPIESSPGARWSAMAREDDEKEGARTVEILSDVAPPLSGELLVRGWLYMSANGLTPVLMCDHLEADDKVVVPLEPHRVALLAEVPSGEVTVEAIDRFLDRWANDVANHTTHVYGRRDMHVALGLTMHSALWMDVGGARRRAWIDCCLIGATRTGKSAAGRAYVKALFGQHFTPMGNFSRPGLTIGTISINGQSKSKPGVFPRNHGKLVILDEAHLMVQDNATQGGLFPMLQGARDIGKVEAAKISGSMMLSAAVRLVSIANWLDGSKNSFATPAQHLLALYGTPESLARLDFGLPIDEIEAGFGPEDVENVWTQERQRAVAIRAWHLDPSQIVFDEDALEEARNLCTKVWKDRYSEELPLFTEKEKVYSVLRIAIAIANMTLSSTEIGLATCHVKLVHVQWAARWLEHTWKLLDYEKVSRNVKVALEPKTMWRLEAMLTVRLGLTDPMAATFTIGRMFGLLSRAELQALTGMQFTEFDKWVTDLVRVGALDVIRPKGNSAFGSQLALRFTKAAIEVIQQLLKIAEQAPEIWALRLSKLQMWNTGGSGVVRDAPDGLLPIDAPIEMHLNDQLRQRRFDQ